MVYVLAAYVNAHLDFAVPTAPDRSAVTDGTTTPAAGLVTEL